MKLKELESILQDCDVFGKNVNNAYGNEKRKIEKKGGRDK